MPLNVSTPPDVENGDKMTTRNIHQTRDWLFRHAVEILEQSNLICGVSSDRTRVEADHFYIEGADRVYYGGRTISSEVMRQVEQTLYGTVGVIQVTAAEQDFGGAEGLETDETITIHHGCLHIWVNGKHDTIEEDETKTIKKGAQFLAQAKDGPVVYSCVYG